MSRLDQLKPAFPLLVPLLLSPPGLSRAVQFVVWLLLQAPGSGTHALGVIGGQISQPDALLVASAGGSSLSSATWASARRPGSSGTSRGRTLSR